MFENVPHVQNKIRLHVSFLLLILIKNGIKNAVTAVINLYMVCLENFENQNFEIASNRSEAGT